MTSLKLENGDLVVSTRYERNLVADLKQVIPSHSRRWDPTRKVWIVAYMYGDQVAQMIERHLGETLAVPKQHTSIRPEPETRLLKIEYIGAAKEREDGSETATGYCNAGWNAIFPLSVLRQWFEGNSDSKPPSEAANFYVILGITKAATAQELKKAYRIAARTWHPDVNDDPNATRQFQVINRAYEVLSDETQRRKYDAGLYLQRQTGSQSASDDLLDIWRPPKRCGYLTVECETVVGRFMIKRILTWQDILNRQGRTMISFWPKLGNFFETEWI